jgi:transcriptional regulator of heat shock response
LFAQPELKDYGHSVSMSVMFDQCEDKIPVLYARIDHEPTVLIGKDNPLGSTCSTILTRLGDDTLLALVGPTRMDYAKNIGAVTYIHSLFS